MHTYAAPLRDIHFVMSELAGFDQIRELPGFEDISLELAHAVLDEAGKFASGVLAPLNRSADHQGARFRDGTVTTPEGTRDAYRQYCDAGWNGISAKPDYGGQGLPQCVAVGVREIMKSANHALMGGSTLTGAAAEALLHAGSDELKQRFVPKLVSGAWAGTMNLTEPQAGSDLSAIRTRAEPHADGNYRLFGQKIFITYGEHDLTENIVHLVLARLTTEPPGSKGGTLFLVPKFLVEADGSLGARNDVKCVSIEHKLGIRASPTCVMAYGDAGGAVGYLVGEPGRGLEHMFVMMNEARLGVGGEGIALAEAAFQLAREHALTRVQGREATTGERVAIIQHPDVRRMLLVMRSRIEAARALAFVVAAAIDRSNAHPDASERARCNSRVELLTPVMKGWSTEMGVEVASLGIQVHGGMGYIEETGAAQYLRDARITTIYEGTTGIQAIDLVSRKILRDGGAAIGSLVDDMRQTIVELAASAPGALPPALGSGLAQGVASLERATRWLLDNGRANPSAVLAVAVPYLHLVGTVCGGWMMARAALAAVRLRASGSSDIEFLEAKVATARFYVEHVLPHAAALAHTVAQGSSAVLSFRADRL
jgi:alkylation response protein AidB-like acyl-CoA dehydrogenase